MIRFPSLLLLPYLHLAGCGDLPAPAQYDHAMLRHYFGKPPEEVECSFGKPASVQTVDSQPPPTGATPEEKATFRQTASRKRHTYSTPDGDLVFSFNFHDNVQQHTNKRSKCIVE